MLEGLATNPANARGRDRRFVLLLIVVGVGWAFRTQQYLVGRAFGVDECSLLLNIASKSWRQLLGPLNHDQAGPPVFLEILRASFVVGGGSELSLHAWSFACAMIALPLFATLAWQLFPGAAAVLVTGMFALSDTLVWHAVEAKQYSGDVLVSAILLWCAIGRPQTSALKRLWLASIFTAAAVWLSHPALFVFAGASLMMWPTVRKAPRGTLQFLAAGTLVGLSFATLYLTSIRIQKSDKLTHMWDDRFVPWAHPLSIVPWLLRSLVSLADYPLKGPGGVCLLALAVIGTTELIRRRQIDLAMLLLVPAGLVLVASAVRAYPFGGHRLTLFWAPMLLLLGGFGIQAWRAGSAPILRRSWWIVPAFLLSWAGIEAAYHVAKPSTMGPMRPALAYLRQHRQPGDGIYVVGQNSASIFAWYWRREPEPVIYKDVVADINRKIPFEQFWVIGMVHPRQGVSEISNDLKWASQGAVETDRVVSVESVAVHFRRK